MSSKSVASARRPRPRRERPAKKKAAGGGGGAMSFEAGLIQKVMRIMAEEAVGDYLWREARLRSATGRRALEGKATSKAASARMARTSDSGNGGER